MTRFGYTLMTEQSGPRELVRYAVAAEDQGFDFEVMSDHYSPWLTEQGHAPYAWTTLGAVAQATERVGLMTYVTCPTLRYHPAVVAQKAATLQILAEGRFTLGLGSGENLNEHVVGEGWPAIQDRQDMLAEAVEIIRSLHTGELVDHRGEYFQVDSARIWDVPDEGVDIGVAVAGDRAIERFAPLADHLVGVEPESSLVEGWNAVDGAPKIGDTARAIGQIPICWDPDRDTAVKKAHEQFRWFGGGWSVNADLPTPAGFAGATQFVRPGGRGGLDPLRPRPRRHRRGGVGVLEGRVHRHRARADRRRRPGPLPRRGRDAAARQAPGGRAMTAAVLFDIDGTLVDSTYHHAIAWHRAFARITEIPPLWRIHRAIGMGGDRLVAQVADDETEEKYGDELREAWRREYLDLRAEVGPLPGAADLVHRLAGEGFVVALASSGDPQFADEAVELLGIRDDLAAVVTSDDVDGSKPAPDLVEETLRRLDGVESAVFVGDTVYDVEAAARAGLGCIALRSGGFGTAELRDAGAVRVESLPSDLLGLDWTPGPPKG